MQAKPNLQGGDSGVTSQPPSSRSGWLAQIAAALSLFVALYLATFFVAGYLAAVVGAYFNQWVSLLSVCAATFGTIAIFEQGVWRLGFFVPPRLAAREILLGCGFAVLLIGAADGLVMLSTRLRHVA